MPGNDLTDLEGLVTQLEADASLGEPDRLRARIEALDALDAYLGADAEHSRAHHDEQDAGSESNYAAVRHRAESIRRKLEAANAALYESIRLQIRREGRSAALREWLEKLARRSENGRPLPGLGYDDQDELISGVLAFSEPGNANSVAEPEMVFYQPTAVRHILDLIELSGLSSADVLIDLGSGMGHVPLLASVLTGASCQGIEVEAAYVACAQQCARSLGLRRVTFLQQDARTADLATGTVFHLYTPFTGAMLARMLERLRSEGANRRIKISTLGPCTAVVAAQPWLQATAPPDPDQITLFHSRP